MILVVDANVLVRMVVGKRAFIDARRAVGRGVELMTTVRQLDEAAGVLTGVFKLDPDNILQELLGVAALMAVTDLEGYVEYQHEAILRLRWKAEDDWPVLAAAMAFDAGIWSDDRDFFGTGVSVWSSYNIDRVSIPPQYAGNVDA